MLEQKIKALKESIKEKRSSYKVLVKRAMTEAEADETLEIAKATKLEAENLLVEVQDLEAKVSELESYLEMQMDENEEEERENSKEERGKKTMTKRKALEKFIRSQGQEKRDLTSANSGIVIPVEVSSTVFETNREVLNLGEFVYSLDVGSASGSVPIAKNNSSILATKEELAEIGDITGDLFTNVEFSIKTRAGKIAISNELLDDSTIDVVGIVTAQLKKLVKNTNNKNVIDVLKTFTEKTANDLDGLKKVFNVDLDVSLNKSVVMSQSAYNHFDTLKDLDGNYVLQNNITAPSGKMLFGGQIIVVPNTFLPVETVGAIDTYEIFVGELESAVGMFNRKEIEATWEKFDNYSKGLAIVLRNDYKKADVDAGVLVKFAVDNT
jgi:HK97 family phage major capsid protein